MEFGFSESLLLIPFDALDDIEHQEVYREFIPTLNLLAAINQEIQGWDELSIH